MAESEPESLPQETRPPVIILHGLAAFPLFMAYWAHRVRKSGRTVHNLGYNSYHTTIPDIAARLSKRINALGCESVDFITHSMGGIVLRWMHSHHPLPRINRAVLTGPPNRGAMLADLLSTEKTLQIGPRVLGECVRQLRRGDLGLANRAGNLDGVEFAVIAGGTGKPNKGFNPWIKGDNDLQVAVDETLLPGMKDFVLVRQLHSSMLLRRQVVDYAINFLDTGKLRRAAEPERSPEN